MADIDEHGVLQLPAIQGSVRLLVVCAPYYRRVTDALLTGTRATAARVGAAVDLIEVPGALEIAPAIGIAARSGRYDGFVALGCVIRGETSHYETVSNDSARALMELGLLGYPIGNGILTVENITQAVVRANPGGQDKGGGAAAAALHLVALSRRFQVRTPGQDRSLPDDRGAIRLAGTPDTGGQA